MKYTYLAEDWRVINSHKPGFVNIYTTRDSGDSTDPIATDFILELGPGSTHRANLIAAAPKMFEALTALLAAFDLGVDNKDVYDHAVIKLANEALDKAML